MIPDLRQFLDRLDTLGDLRRISSAALKYEIGAISIGVWGRVDQLELIGWGSDLRS